MTDWTKASSMSQTQRLTAILTDAKEAGIPWRKAAIVTIIGVNESGVTPFIPNTTSKVLPSDCYPVRQILRLERGDGSSGGQLSDHGVIFDELSPAAQKFLSDNAYYDADIDGLKSPGYDSLSKPSAEDQAIFEYALANRIPKIAALYSIGMTQMYLTYSPSLGGNMVGRFDTLNDLWRFYTCRDIATLIASKAYDYLPVYDSRYPTPSSSRQTVQNYMSAFQTGQLDWNIDMWAQYLTNVINNVKWVWSVGTSVGYSPT